VIILARLSYKENMSTCKKQERTNKILINKKIRKEILSLLILEQYSNHPIRFER